MILVPALTALCDSLSTQTGAQVALGRPEQASGGIIYVWPWRLVEDAVARHAVPRSTGRDTAVPHGSAMVVHVLILVRPATTPEGLALLEMARQALLDQPILDVADRRVQIQFESLPHAELAALFSAAELPLSICLGARLRLLD